MIESDTVRLLRQCDAGVKMGIASIGDVAGRVEDPAFRQDLDRCRQEHEQLKGQIRARLHRFHDRGKEPSPMAKGMSRIKTAVKMELDRSDRTAAALMTDGCNMGVKSLNQYLNQYKAADEASKDIAKRLIALEAQLAVDIRKYL